jgi:hypothetical protein
MVPEGQVVLEGRVAGGASPPPGTHAAAAVVVAEAALAAVGRTHRHQAPQARPPVRACARPLHARAPLARTLIRTPQHLVARVERLAQLL